MNIKIDTNTGRALAHCLAILEQKAARTAVPPKGAQTAGQRALDLVKQGRAGKGFTGVGRARAAQLARGATLSEATVRRMNNYFTRHASDRKPDWGKAGQETPGYVAWLAWGGDAGATWAAAQVAKWDREDGKKEFPLWLPDGSEVRTVGQVAALLSVDEKVAALYVLEQKGLDPKMYDEAKALLPPPDSDTSGIAIMLYPSENDATQIAIEGGTKPKDLHITLGYFGSVTRADVDKGDLQELAQQIAQSFAPFKVDLNGLARFTMTEQDALVVNADSPVLEDMRIMLLAACKEAGIEMVRNHGYNAHMTLGYVPADEEPPIHRWLSKTITISRIGVGYGVDYTFYALSPSGEAKDVFSGGGTGGIAPRRGVPAPRARVIDRIGKIWKIRKRPRA